MKFLNFSNLFLIFNFIRNAKIKDLEEESDYLKKVLSEHQTFFKENESYEELSSKLQSYENLSASFRQLLVAEEKREVPFFE